MIGFPNAEKRDAAQSNGHLMRASPLALVEDQDRRGRAVRKDTALTNPSSCAQNAASTYVELLHGTASLDPEKAQASVRQRTEVVLAAAATSEDDHFAGS